MNVLAIGAHPDDIEILCAGTLALYAEAGYNVFMAVATNGNVGSPTLGREEIASVRLTEQKRSCAVIDAKLIWMNFDDEWLFNNRDTRTTFIDAIRLAKPDVMLIHSPNDYHPDHRISSQVAEDSRIPASVRLVETELPAVSKIPRIFHMDNVAGIGFEPEVYVDITSVMDTKREMLNCHESQNLWLNEMFDSTTESIMERLSSMRGQAIEASYAECFREVKTFPFAGSQAPMIEKQHS